MGGLPSGSSLLRASTALLCIFCMDNPSKRARFDSEVFWLWPVTAIIASVWPESGWVVCVGSDFLHPIQLHSSEEGPDQHVENWPGSDLDGLVRFWPNTSALEVSQCARVTVTVWAKWLRPGNKLACKNRQACFWPTLPNRSRLDASQSSMFTGVVFCPL